MVITLLTIKSVVAATLGYEIFHHEIGMNNIQWKG